VSDIIKVEKEQLEDELEEKEMLKFTIMFFSIIIIFTVTATIMVLNMNIDSKFGVSFDDRDDCNKCDEDDDYYNETIIIDYKQLLEVCVNERYNEGH